MPGAPQPPRPRPNPGRELIIRIYAQPHLASGSNSAFGDGPQHAWGRLMPFYFRKSVSAGPFRLNFSKSGVGMSVGVRGLRVGTGPRGHYVHAGMGGLYYRSSIGHAGERRRPSSPIRPDVAPSPPPSATQGVVMVEVESADVLEMRDASVGELVDDINAKAGRLELGKIVAWSGVGLGFAALLVNGQLALTIWLATGPAWLFARWLDSYQRRVVVFYELEPDAQAAYEALTSAFDGLNGCSGKWHVAAGGAVTDLTTWKRNAGASHIISKKPTSLAYNLPKVLAANITPPSAQVGLQTLYFLPDCVLVAHGAKVGAVGYSDLELRWQDSNFIEEGRVPADAQVISQTWKHPNKSGGPDRRFRDNHLIPVCRYEVLHLRSVSGLNELLEFSRTGVSSPFAAAAAALGRLNAASERKISAAPNRLPN